MTTKVFEANGKKYDVAMASAVKQDQLLGLLAQRLFLSAGIAKNENSTLNEHSVMISMMTLPTEAKQQVADIVTEQAFEVGTTNAASIKDFEGHMVEWNRFLARLVIWNLGDFFDLLANAEELEKMMRA